VSLAQQHFAIQPSRFLALIIALMHGGVLALLFLLPLPEFAVASLFFVIMFSGAYYLLRDALLKLGSAWIALQINAQGVVLKNCNLLKYKGILKGGSVVTAGMVILHVALTGRRNTVYITLMPDSMDAESFRQLRVLLKLGRTWQ
jgi:hypothetical protein